MLPSPGQSGMTLLLQLTWKMQHCNRAPLAQQAAERTHLFTSKGVKINSGPTLCGRPNFPPRAQPNCAPYMNKATGSRRPAPSSSTPAHASLSPLASPAAQQQQQVSSARAPLSPSIYPSRSQSNQQSSSMGPFRAIGNFVAAPFRRQQQRGPAARPATSVRAPLHARHLAHAAAANASRPRWHPQPCLPMCS